MRNGLAAGRRAEHSRADRANRSGSFRGGQPPRPGVASGSRAWARRDQCHPVRRRSRRGPHQVRWRAACARGAGLAGPEGGSDWADLSGGCRSPLSWPSRRRPRRGAARAAALHLRVEMPFERARTLLCEGETLRRLRRPVAARPPLLEALATFESLGARPWAARAEIELAATGVRARTVPDVAQAGLDSLTPQEFQVAQSVAVGRNNVEVASSLFVSRKTVEAHLTRIYRKLGVRSRTELARRLASVSIPPVQAVMTSRAPVGASR